MPAKVAFLSHSIYGTSHSASARRMRSARDRSVVRAPEIECDGELPGDAALSETIRQAFLAQGTLTGEANLLVLPNLDAANILFNVLKATSGKWRDDRPHLAGHGGAGPHPHAVGHDAAGGQHDGAGGGRHGGHGLAQHGLMAPGRCR